jgi:hypothetical protein
MKKNYLIVFGLTITTMALAGEAPPPPQDITHFGCNVTYSYVFPALPTKSSFVARPLNNVSAVDILIEDSENIYTARGIYRDDSSVGFMELDLGIVRKSDSRVIARAATNVAMQPNYAAMEIVAGAPLSSGHLPKLQCGFGGIVPASR